MTAGARRAWRSASWRSVSKVRVLPASGGTAENRPAPSSSPRSSSIVDDVSSASMPSARRPRRTLSAITSAVSSSARPKLARTTSRIGAYGIALPYDRPWPSRYVTSRFSHHCRNSNSRRDFPIPASPTMPTTCPCPLAATSNRLRSRSSSRSRPTNRANVPPSANPAVSRRPRRWIGRAACATRVSSNRRSR